MNADNIKQIPIRDYLKKRGVHPTKEYSGYGMYMSPFRDERTPSLKVDYNRNLWHDFGSGEGGSVIDLVMKLERRTFTGAMDQLKNFSSIRPGGNDLSFSFHRDPVGGRVKPSGITLVEDLPLGHPRLLEYLRSRKIDVGIAAGHCREIHYRVGGNSYYAIGFANDAGGYEIRNRSFKGCIAPKDITHIWQEEENGSCFLFEGFMDYLSLLTIRHRLNPEYPCTDWRDYIILNSTANLQKAIPLLADYEKIHSFLDNDRTGMAVYRELQKELGTRMRDASRLYPGYKDLNEYLCAGEHLKLRQTPSRPVQKRKRGLGI